MSDVNQFNRVVVSEVYTLRSEVPPSAEVVPNSVTKIARPLLIALEALLRKEDPWVPA